MGREAFSQIGRGRSRYLSVFFGLLTALTIVLLIVGIASLSWAVSVIAVFFGIASLGLLRASGRSACLSANELRIHNLLRSYNLGRSDIADFVIDDMKIGGGAGRYEMIYVQRADGRMIGIEASARSRLMKRTAEEELVEERDKLRAWLSGSPSP